jgi:hypothetical protein
VKNLLKMIEYKVVRFDIIVLPYTRFEDYLNGVGKEGFELVNVLPVNTNRGVLEAHTFIFKKNNIKKIW